MSAVTETPLEILGDVGSTPQKISGVEETPVDVVSAEELQVKSVPDSERQTDTAETKDAGATSNTGQVSGDNDGETTVTAKTLGEPNGKDAMLDSSADSAMVEIEVDELAPADSLWTTQRDAAVKLRLKASGPGSETPVTIPSFFKSIVARNPNGVAMAVKREGQWQKWTYSQYFADVRTAAKAFIKLGLEPYKGVGIIGFNSPEWFLADLGCIFAGGLVSGIYTTNSPEACRYVAASCQANVLVVENHQQLQKILQVRDQLPHLKAIVQYSGEVAVKDDNIYTWSQFMEKGRDVSDEILDNRINAQAPNKCCMLIYTSGTTGNPKGVMLSHDNLTWTLGTMMKECATHLPLQFGQLSMVSYLPLSHIAAQMLDIYVVMGFGGTTYFAQPDALKGSLKNTLVEVRPHVFLGVPRVWEKMQESLVEMGRNLSGLKKRIGRWAKGVGLKANYALMNGGSTPFGMGIADFLLFKKVRNGLGLDRCVLRLSGAAPITKDTLEYFMSINQPICEVYGMSECSGPHTNAFPMVNRVTSVGKELTGVMTVLDKPDADGNGEVVMHGRHVFMGYLDEEEKTREALDDNGGLHSGDVGKKDKDGFLYITGRIKELIITAGGENIPPVAIEDAVKEALPAVSQCMLIGDKRRFLSLLLSLKVEVDPDSQQPTGRMTTAVLHWGRATGFQVEVDPDSQEPTDKLTPAALDWVREAGSQASTVSAILDPGDRVVLQAIQRGIDKVNSRATSNAQKIQKWSLLPKDFSIPGGELGPTMKMRRPIIHKMYMKTIDAFYEDTPITPTTPAPPAAAAALSAS